MKKEQVKTVSRESARAVVSLFAAAIICYVIMFITLDTDEASVILPCVLAILGFVLFAVAIVIRLTKLRCPYCRQSLAPVRWKRPADIPCEKCGKRYKYSKM